MEKEISKKKTHSTRPARSGQAVARKVAPKKEAAPKAATKKAIGLDVPVYDLSGKKGTTATLPEAVFGVSWNADLVHQVVLGMQANARAGRGGAHTKDRSEVRGGGKKPWRQKGTGRARHGSIRSPIWIGGGVTHGPRKDKDYSVRIPKKMRAKALFVALSHKLHDNEILFVDAVSFAQPSTKEAKTALTALEGISGSEKLGKKEGNAALFVTLKNDDAVKKSFQNIKTVAVEEARNLNVVDVLSYKFIVIENPEEAGKILSAKMK